MAKVAGNGTVEGMEKEKVTITYMTAEGMVEVMTTTYMMAN